MSLTTFRLLEHATLDFALDVSGMGLTDAWLEEMAPRVTHAFEEMTALELGSIANHDEGRRVGHSSLRSSQAASRAWFISVWVAPRLVRSSSSMLCSEPITR